MYICVSCRREMRCDKNGVGVDYGYGHVYPSDRYKCPDCGIEILATTSKSIRDSDYKTQEEYLKAKQKGIDY